MAHKLKIVKRGRSYHIYGCIYCGEEIRAKTQLVARESLKIYRGCIDRSNSHYGQSNNSTL